MNENINNTLKELKHRSDPWLNFNKRGQLLIIIILTVIVLLLRLGLYFISEYGVLILNLIAFGLVFFWVSRIVFTEVRMDPRIAQNADQKRNFILVTSLCFLAMDFVLLTDELFVSPLAVLCLGFFLAASLFSSILDRLILKDTHVFFYFKVLSIIIILIVILNSIIALLIH